MKKTKKLALLALALCMTMCCACAKKDNGSAEKSSTPASEEQKTSVESTQSSEELQESTQSSEELQESTQSSEELQESTQSSENEQESSADGTGEYIQMHKSVDGVEYLVWTDYDKYFGDSPDYAFYCNNKPKDIYIIHKDAGRLTLADAERICKENTSFEDVYREILALQPYPDDILNDSTNLDMKNEIMKNYPGGYAFMIDLVNDPIVKEKGVPYPRMSLYIYVEYGKVNVVNTSKSKVLELYKDEKAEAIDKEVCAKIDEWYSTHEDLEYNNVTGNKVSTIEELLK